MSVPLPTIPPPGSHGGDWFGSRWADVAGRRSELEHAHCPVWSAAVQGSGLCRLLTRGPPGSSDHLGGDGRGVKAVVGPMVKCRSSARFSSWSAWFRSTLTGAGRASALLWSPSHVRDPASHGGAGQPLGTCPSDSVSTVTDYESLLSACQATLDEVEAALARLADGTYGTCQSCGAEIPDELLAAEPTGTSCGRHGG
jgi:hypothetical protein